MSQTVLIRTPLFDMMLLCHIALYKIVLSQSMRISGENSQSERYLELISTVPALVGFMITIQNTIVLPKVLRNRRAWSIRFYDSTIPICYVLTILDFATLLFQMTAPDSHFLDRADQKKIFNDEIILNLALVYFVMMSIRLLYSITVGLRSN